MPSLARQKEVSMDNEELEATVEAALEYAQQIRDEISRVAQELAVINKHMVSIDQNLYVIGSVK